MGRLRPPPEAGPGLHCPQCLADCRGPQGLGKKRTGLCAAVWGSQDGGRTPVWAQVALGSRPGPGCRAAGSHLGQRPRGLEQLPPVLCVADADFPQVLLFHHIRPLGAERRT